MSIKKASAEKPRPFTKAEVKTFVRLLRKVQSHGWFLPEGAFEPFHGVASMWAPELVIVSPGDGTPEILLAKYDGGAKAFHGKWHIPGGYNRWHEPDIQATCSRVAQREIGTDVRFDGVLDAYKWKLTPSEHPYGHPLSLYVRCTLLGNVKETGRLRFFRVDCLPKNLVLPHRRFIADECLGLSPFRPR